MKLIKYVSIAAAALTLWSCQKDEVGVSEGEGSDVATPITQSVEIKSLMGIKNFPVVRTDDKDYPFRHDDMVFEVNDFDDPNAPDLERPQTPEKGALAIEGRVRKWPNNTVYYNIKNLSSRVKSNLDIAFKEWETKTGIRFKQHTNEPNFINIIQEENCNCGYASLGARRGGVVSLGANTSPSVIIHEIGHTLGFIHEQNRSDRDEVIKVNFDNIQQGWEDQYYKNNRSVALTDKMDVGSIMMYDVFSTSRGRGLPTMSYADGSALPRKSGRLSAGDIAGTNKAYPGKGTDGGSNPTKPTTPKPKPKPKNACDGVAQWNSGQSYKVGDRVTYRGYLFERDFSRWNMLQKCGTAQSKDKCAGISEYNGGSYKIGDKVTFRGSLYRRVDGGWIKEGQCGS